MKSVYFDNAATTQVHDDVVDSIMNVLKTNYGNPSSTHSFGRSSKSLIEKSRKAIAGYLNVSASEIIENSSADKIIFLIDCRHCTEKLRLVL